MSRCVPLFFFNAAVLFDASLPATCMAADINWSADMLSRLQYQDNVAQSAVNPVADTSMQIFLTSRVWRKTQTMESEMGLVLKEENNRRFNEFEQDMKSLSLSQLFRRERGQYSLQGAVNQSTTLGNGFESGEFVRRNLDVDTRTLNVGGSRQLSEVFSGSLSGGITNVRYEQVQAISNQDYDDEQLSASLRYQDSLSADWQLSTYVDVLDQLQSGLDVKTLGVTLLRSYKWNDIWSLSGKIGRRKTEFTGETFLGEQFTQVNYARVSTLDIKHAGERSNWGVGASEDLSPRVNGVIDATSRLSVWWDTRLSQYSVLKLNFSQVERKPIDTLFYQDDATRYKTFGVGYQLAISESLSTDMQLRWTERAITSSASRNHAESGMASIGLRWLVHP